MLISSLCFEKCNNTKYNFKLKYIEVRIPTELKDDLSLTETNLMKEYLVKKYIFGIFFLYKENLNRFCMRMMHIYLLVKLS